MNRKNIYSDDCPILHTLNIISGKWRFLILWHLSGGALRYNQLKRKMPGVTNIMLTRSLQDLEEYNLVRRTQYSEIPPHVEYYLSDHAKKLIPALTLIKEWGNEQLLIENSKLTRD